MEEEGDSRAQVRQGYKDLMEAIANNGGKLATQSENDHNELLDYLKTGDQLFSQVKAPQECVMDATVVKNLSRICKEQAHQMSANVNQFKYEEYVDKLKLNLRGLDKKKWLMFGE